MLNFPCNQCCVYQYYEFKHIIDEQEKKLNKVVLLNCCLVLVFSLIRVII